MERSSRHLLRRSRTRAGKTSPSPLDRRGMMAMNFGFGRKSARGLAHSKSWRICQRIGPSRSVFDGGSPLPLWVSVCWRAPTRSPSGHNIASQSQILPASAAGGQYQISAFRCPSSNPVFHFTCAGSARLWTLSGDVEPLSCAPCRHLMSFHRLTRWKSRTR